MSKKTIGVTLDDLNRWLERKPRTLVAVKFHEKYLDELRLEFSDGSVASVETLGAVTNDFLCAQESVDAESEQDLPL